MTSTNKDKLLKKVEAMREQITNGDPVTVVDLDALTASINTLVTA